MKTRLTSFPTTEVGGCSADASPNCGERLFGRHRWVWRRILTPPHNLRETIVTPPFMQASAAGSMICCADLSRLTYRRHRLLWTVGVTRATGRAAAVIIYARHLRPRPFARTLVVEIPTPMSSKRVLSTDACTGSWRDKTRHFRNAGVDPPDRIAIDQQGAMPEMVLSTTSSSTHQMQGFRTLLVAWWTRQPAPQFEAPDGRVCFLEHRHRK